MKVITQMDDIGREFPNANVALGTFDGIHIGHQKIISRAVKLARSMNGSSVVFTFSNHPLSVIAPEKCPLQIMSQNSKSEVMEALGVDVLVSISVTKDFLQLSPNEFVAKLVEKLRPVHLVVGPNYSFGYKGLGTPQLLTDLGRQYGFSTEVLDAVYVGDTMVSSTVIRQMITEGEVDRALVLLGRPFLIEGKVVKGDGRGRLLGYPTANLAYSEGFILPGDGVYAVKIDIDQQSYYGVANVGNNPTFNLDMRRIEVHVMNFSGDLYDKTICVHFISPIRKEIKFDSSDALKAQIMADAGAAREMLEKFQNLYY